MLYRIRFDSNVGAILREAGIRGVKEQLDFWPAGETAKAIEIGQQLGLTPAECASIAVDYVYRKKIDVGEIGDSPYFPMTPSHLFNKVIDYMRLRDQLD
jgi:hypothetical protein